MLLNVTRIGALRQLVHKGFAVVEGDPAPASGHHGVTLHTRPGAPPGLWHASTPLTWLGSQESRARWAGSLAGALSEAARRAVLLPAATTTEIGGARVVAPTGDDVHVVEVASTGEQEVLCNLVREHVPLLIALAGRADPGGSAVDGSHRLAGSREHIAARYLASTSPRHLSRVEAELRRADGIAQIAWMDVFPGREPDGTLTVTVRCVDAAASLATTRAHAVLVGALALRARRLVRDGRRLGNVPQELLERNRVRVIARGLRARLAVDAPPAGPRERGQRGAPPREAAAPEPVPARTQLRRFLEQTLSIELDNLGATPEELFPVVAPIDLPDLGLSHIATEDSLLRAWAAQQRAGFAGTAARALLDPGAGGPLLQAARQVAPGRTGLLLDEWAAIVAARRGAGDNPPSRAPSQRTPDRRSRPGRTGRAPSNQNGSAAR
ncbi:hypothetical protein [Dactylosporangium sp. CA-139066]|uniref:hypothetical protein n=1 Tax=Dactylosporangium sp. CA-139066 TaxID=3239930 RepID=UPI003D92E456